MNETCQACLAEAFPPETDEEVVRVIQQGILLADDTLKSVPFLNTKVGRDLRGFVRRAAVMWRMHESCAAGDLPFEAKMARMEKGSIHHLEIRSSGFLAHIVRTDSVQAFPEQSETRQDRRLTSAQDLFSQVVAFNALLPTIAEKYAWLTFGTEPAGRLLHAAWGMPAREHDEWLGHIDIIRRTSLTDGLSDAENREQPSAKLQLKFKEHIAEALQANDNDEEVG